LNYCALLALDWYRWGGQPDHQNSPIFQCACSRSALWVSRCRKYISSEVTGTSARTRY